MVRKMVLYVRSPALKRRVFKTMNRYDKLAIKCYSKGKMIQGKRYEKKSDRLYKKNYNKIFARR
jgi:hypothetical protein